MSGEQLPESTAHILIVDDLPDHLAFAGTILRQQGYRVHAATSGRQRSHSSKSGCRI